MKFCKVEDGLEDEEEDGLECVETIGERVKGEAERVREELEGASEGKERGEVDKSEERDGPGRCCREKDWSSRGMSMAGGNLRCNDGAVFSFSVSVSSPESRWDRLEGRAEVGVRDSCGSEFSKTARSVALRVRDGLDVACDEEGRDADGDGTSRERSR